MREAQSLKRCTAKREAMKHSIKITTLLLAIFILAQINGLFVLDYYIDIEKSAVAGKTVVDEAAYAQSNITPPVVENESVSYIYILIALLVGTALVLLLIKFQQRKLWKAWFFLSVVVTLIISLNSWMFRFFGTVAVPSVFLYLTTVALCSILAYYKVFRPNVFIHNITEIFIYGGLAALLVPILNLFSVVVLLILVAFYDMYAVWKSKHMVAMAQFQTQEKVFAGLYIPYKLKETNYGLNRERKEKIQKEKTSGSIAVLGGGDIAFPLLFSGVILKTIGAYWPTLIIIGTTTLALLLLFYYGEKGKYYPAIPFIALGCFLGYGIISLLTVLF